MLLLYGKGFSTKKRAESKSGRAEMGERKPAADGEFTVQAPPFVARATANNSRTIYLTAEHNVEEAKAFVLETVQNIERDNKATPPHDKKAQVGALFVDFTIRVEPDYQRHLLANNFKPVYREGNNCRWKLWCHRTVPDSVPEWRTSVAGVCVLVLSSDSERVLLVHENGHWKPVTGEVKTGQSAVTAAYAEAREEVGIELVSPLRLIGGWNTEAFRPDGTNDNTYVLAAKAQKNNIEVDGYEITMAKWFTLDQLHELVGLEPWVLKYCELALDVDCGTRFTRDPQFLGQRTPLGRSYYFINERF